MLRRCRIVSFVVVSLTFYLNTYIPTTSFTQNTGEFHDAGGGKPDDLAAIQVTPGSPDWILAKVMSHDAATGMYTLSDEDTESNKSTYIVLCDVSWCCCYLDYV